MLPPLYYCFALLRGGKSKGSKHGNMGESGEEGKEGRDVDGGKITLW